MKIALVLGTRPEIIKMSPIIKELEKRDADYFTLHTGQHYSYNMDEAFFDEIKIPKPKYNIGVRSKSPIHQGDHTGRMLTLIEETLLKEKPDTVLVLGDTNTVLAGAICASKFRTSKINVTLCHVEAGLRSFERTLPEEINRIVADSLSDVLFAPTETSKKNLLSENIPEEKIRVTGNTIVDAIEFFRNRLSTEILDKTGMNGKDYILLTAHREYNVDVSENFHGILEGAEKTSKEFGLDVVYPVHPRAMKMIKTENVKIPECVRITDPVGYTDFLSLQKHAKLVLTDSGGVQEESCILGVPCVTLRESTERPETLDIGCNILAGTDPDSILEAARKVTCTKEWKHPFGSNAAKKIVDVML